MSDELKQWSPGWLPAGWTRGAPLRVINANYRGGAMIALQHVFTRFVDASCGPAALDVTLRFHHAERYKVLQWLRWYFDGDTTQYACVAAQIRN